MFLYYKKVCYAHKFVEKIMSKGHKNALIQENRGTYNII